METLFNRILGEVRKGNASVVVTVVDSLGSTPRKIGAKMCVFADGRSEGTIGGGALEKTALEEARQALRKRVSYLKSYSLDRASGLQACGGRVALFFDVVKPRHRLVICGGGHIGLALSYLGKLLDFDVTVVDYRRAFADKARFGHVDRVVCKPYRSALRPLAKERDTFVVIVTHGHVFDAICCAEALKTPSRYIGMIGSRKKIATVFADLRKRGFTQKDLRRIVTPVGLDIGAESPAEIAVAIAAQLVQSRTRPRMEVNHEQGCC